MIVYCVVSYDLEDGEIGLFLGIVYLVKFREIVENVLGNLISLLKVLVDVVGEDSLVVDLLVFYDVFK